MALAMLGNPTIINNPARKNHPHMSTILEPKTASCTPCETPRQAARFVTPDVNIFEAENGWTLQAEMPGVSKDGLEVTLEGSELTLIGRRADANPEATPLWRESYRADYRRVFELDPTVDATRISAQMEQGILTLHLPKAERVKPRRIKVTE